MKIILAKTSGFCMGVKRAMQLATDTAKNGVPEVYTIGPLIHNPQAVKHLQELGVGLITDVSEASEKDTIIIRAHGIPLETLNLLKAKGVKIIDATCPHVVTSQKQIKEYSEKGYQIIIIGDPEHPEIQSLASFANNSILIKDYEAAVAMPDLPAPVMIIAQTTYNAQEFSKISSLLKQRANEAIVCNSICLATSKRQEEIEKLAPSVDAVIIVGGKNSANTRRLAEIATNHCNQVKHIETEEELVTQDYASCRSVLISAGASTPDFVTDKVVAWLRHLS